MTLFVLAFTYSSWARGIVILAVLSSLYTSTSHIADGAGLDGLDAGIG